MNPTPVKTELGNLHVIEDAVDIRWRSAGTQKLIYRGVNKNLQESYRTPLEALHDHFSVTPSSHFAHQKGKGFRLMGLRCE